MKKDYLFYPFSLYLHLAASESEPLQLVAKKAFWRKFGNFAKIAGNKALEAAQNPELQQLALQMLV